MPDNLVLFVPASAFTANTGSEQKHEDDEEDRGMGRREQVRDHRYVPGVTTPA